MTGECQKTRNIHTQMPIKNSTATSAQLTTVALRYFSRIRRPKDSGYFENSAVRQRTAESWHQYLTGGSWFVRSLTSRLTIMTRPTVVLSHALTSLAVRTRQSRALEIDDREITSFLLTNLVITALRFAIHYRLACKTCGA